MWNLYLSNNWKFVDLIMASIIIHTPTDKDLHLLQELASKMGFRSTVLSDEEKEGYALAQAIEENNTTESLQFNEALEYYKSLEKAK